MKTKCYSVRLKSLNLISPRCYEAISFDGKRDLMPVSQVFGMDMEVGRSEAYWISAWILERKDIQYSTKKEGWFNPKTRRVEPKITVRIETHVPKKKPPININADINLLK